MTEESLVKICESAFSSDEIEGAKSLLLESLNKPLDSSKSEEKKLRNIEEIISFFKETDSEVIPVFVAKNLEKLPTVSYDNIDMTPLLKRLDLLEKTVQDIPHNYVSKSELKDLVIEYAKENSVQEQNVKIGDGLNTMDPSNSVNNSSFNDVNESNECSSVLQDSVNKSMRPCHSSPFVEGESETASDRMLPRGTSSDNTTNETAVERTSRVQIDCGEDLHQPSTSSSRQRSVVACRPYNTVWKMEIDRYVNVRYKLKSSDQFEEYLKLIGVGLIQRKAACAVSPVAVLTKDGDTYTFTMTTTFKTITFTFKFNEEFIEERPDGVKLKSLVVADGEVMTQTQTEDNGRRSTHVRTFTPEILTVVTTVDGWPGKCVRVYEVIKD
ncbi:hypothetical protein PYW07_008316 [Mythimna separata]|uniref:Lipocalin/cytosolic fatty-acid binding domain-containing protein n=1 Tax=Mythimna separata TaxID=271217 RepID=A0AAD7YCF8_MYTSE|nr:hypothetical protein PYW07_008316 [Mythimna separata]